MIARIVLFPISLLWKFLFLLFQSVEEDRAYVFAERLIPLVFSTQYFRRRRNMKRIFCSLGWTKSQISELNRRHLLYLSHMVVDIARITTIAYDDLCTRVQLEGEKHLVAALSQGKGVLLIGTHLGNWWYTRAFLASKGYSISNVSNRMPIGSIERQIQSVRDRFLINTIYAGRGASRAAEDVFRRNEIFSLQFDVSVPGREHHSQWFPLGNAMIQIDLGSAALALKNAVPVLWATMKTISDRQYLLTIQPAPHPDHPNPLEPRDIMLCWLDCLYKELLDRPEEWWHWNHIILRRMYERKYQ